MFHVKVEINLSLWPRIFVHMTDAFWLSERGNAQRNKAHSSKAIMDIFNHEKYVNMTTLYWKRFILICDIEHYASSSIWEREACSDTNCCSGCSLGHGVSRWHSVDGTEGGEFELQRDIFCKELLLCTFGGLRADRQHRFVTLQRGWEVPKACMVSTVGL